MRVLPALPIRLPPVRRPLGHPGMTVEGEPMVQIDRGIADCWRSPVLACWWTAKAASARKEGIPHRSRVQTHDQKHDDPRSETVNYIS